MDKNSFKDVILIKTNLKDYDPRLSKEIDSLLNLNYKVTLLCWNRECKPETQVMNENFREIKFNLKAPTGIKIIPYLPIWWIFEIYWLLKLNVYIIHPINLDSILPAIFISKIKKNRVIYEMYDTYEDHILLPNFLRNFLINIDKIFMKHSNAVIIVDGSRKEEFNGIPNDNISIIYNSPPDSETMITVKDNQEFNIFYAGLLENNRSLEIVMEAVKQINGVKLTIAGFGDLSFAIKKYAEENPDKFSFLGKINHNTVLNFSSTSNLLFSLYNPIIPLNRYASSNKLFEAMMCKKPILVSKGTAMANLVRKHKCGLVVDCNDIEEIKDAIIYLKNNPQICLEMGSNGRQAYEKVYNWNIMEKKLLKVYEEISYV